MLEAEKKKYPHYRISERQTAKRLGSVNMALYFTSDRRDEDNDHLCVYLKKSYEAICDKADIREGDIIKLENGERLRTLSVAPFGRELLLHLESTQILNTGAFDFEEGDNV